MQPVMKSKPIRISLAALLLALVGAALLFSACTQEPTETPVMPTPEQTPVTPTATRLPPTPTLTPEPLAATVNGEAITLAEFESELARYQAAKPELEIGASDRQEVLDNLIHELLLAQGAREAGFNMDEAGLQARLDGLVSELGSEQALQDWLTAYQYSLPSFQLALKRASEAAWMRDEIIAGVSGTAGQVRARQVLLYNSEDAANVLGRLNSGTNFATLAAEFDPVTLGELGWFPRGYLLEPAIEEAAFALQAGEHSQIIETRLGFHIIQVIERQEDRPLEPDALQALRRIAIQAWLASRRSQGQIEVLFP